MNATDGQQIKYLLAPIFKVSEGSEGMFVEGCLAAEEPDFENEIMDYESSKPNFVAWNEDRAAKTGGLSVGNLRGQHNASIAAGKFVEMTYDDAAKKVMVIAKVIDPIEQDKVREGVYTSFSIGSPYVKKWRDGKYMRWTAAPFEGSLVDVGSMPSTRGFVYCAAGGRVEHRNFDSRGRAVREALEAIKTKSVGASLAELDGMVKTAVAALADAGDTAGAIALMQYFPR